MSFSRLQTSKSRLNIRWQRAPVADSIDIQSLDDVLAYLGRQSGGKPVLINRESEDRSDKLAALHKAALGSERFSLASQWFHCVKVSDTVLGEGHPLHELFAGKNPPALVLVSADGSKTVSFLGTTKQKVKWAPITSVLKASYKKNPTGAVKGLEKLLCTFDIIDGKQNELATQLKRAQEKGNNSKIAAIEKKIASAQKELEEALAEEQKLRELVLKDAATDD